jgi:YD repeat-containing protein
MTVLGQPTVNYTYDAADRLTQITQGSATVSFTYDNANRRTSLTLPNGVGLSYIKSPSVKAHFGAPVRANEPTGLSRRAKVILALIAATMIALWIWVMLTA